MSLVASGCSAIVLESSGKYIPMGDRRNRGKYGENILYNRVQHDAFHVRGDDDNKLIDIIVRLVGQRLQQRNAHGDGGFKYGQIKDTQRENWPIPPLAVHQGDEKYNCSQHQIHNCNQNGIFAKANHNNQKHSSDQAMDQ